MRIANFFIRRSSGACVYVMSAYGKHMHTVVIYYFLPEVSVQSLRGYITIRDHVVCTVGWKTFFLSFFFCVVDKATDSHVFCYDDVNFSLPESRGLEVCVILRYLSPI